MLRAKRLKHLSQNRYSGAKDRLWNSTGEADLIFSYAGVNSRWVSFVGQKSEQASYSGNNSLVKSRVLR